MNNRIRKTLSVLIAVLMIAILLPTASLADTSVHLKDIPVGVTNVVVHLVKEGTVYTIDCDQDGGSNQWSGSDSGDFVSDDIDYITLQWAGGSVNIPFSYWIAVGQESEGTLNRRLEDGWNATSVTVTKTWADNNDQDGKRPENVTIRLIGGGIEKTGTVTGTGNIWTYEFTGLQKYNNGVLITYTADEVSVPDGYSKTVNDLNITNTHTPETTSVLVTKVWNDSNDQDDKRPESINVKVYDGTREVASRAIGSPEWAYEFTGLQKYRDGSLIVYTIDEDPVAGYSKTVNGYNITNARTPETVTISGTKTWNSIGDPQPPTAITVNVKKGTEIAATATVVSPWTYQFILPKYENGTPIVYTVEEAPVTNYTPAYTETESGVDILNTYTPPITPKGTLRVLKSVSGTTAEDAFEFTVDGPNAYHTHVTLRGSAYMDIPNLTLGDYIVQEINIPSGYAVDGLNPKTIKVEAGTTPSTITFINNYTPPTVPTGSLKITKTITGGTPTSTALFTFKITKTGGSSVEVTINGAGTVTKDGLAYGDYTVEEINVPSGYTPVGGSQPATVGTTTPEVSFTNTYTPPSEETGTLTIRKHVEGEGAPAGDEFDFSIQMVQMLEEYSVMAYAPFSLKDGEGRTYTNLRPGKYLITETNWPDGYEPKSKSKEVAVNAGENPDVIFTNYYKHKDPPTLTYTVSYHPNGGLGTVPVDMNRYYPGDKAWLKSGAGLYRPNFVFAGWSLINGTRVNDPYIMGRSDVTFFAIWVPVKVPKTGDQAAPYGLLMMSGAVILAVLNLIGKRKHTAK